MYAIFKHAFMFRLPNADTDLSGTAAIPGVVRNLRVDASPNPQQVPDWVGQTRLWRGGCESGKILEIKGLTASALQIANTTATDTDGISIGLQPPEVVEAKTKAARKSRLDADNRRKSNLIAEPVAEPLVGQFETKPDQSVGSKVERPLDRKFDPAVSSGPDGPVISKADPNVAPKVESKSKASK